MQKEKEKEKEKQADCRLQYILFCRLYCSAEQNKIIKYINESIGGTEGTDRTSWLHMYPYGSV